MKRNIEERKLRRVELYAKETSKSFKEAYLDEEFAEDREEILGQIIVFDGLNDLLEDGLDSLRYHVQKTLKDMKEIHNEVEFKSAKDLFWGYILALETIELLLDLDELEEDYEKRTK